MSARMARSHLREPSDLRLLRVRPIPFRKVKTTFRGAAFSTSTHASRRKANRFEDHSYVCFYTFASWSEPDKGGPGILVFLLQALAALRPPPNSK